MTQATHALQVLAAARSALTTAAKRLDEATRENSALLVRLTEAQARSAEAFRLARANGDADGKYALAMKFADEDARDIQTLLDKSSLLIPTLNAEFNGAQIAANEAEAGARREEDEITANALTSHIDSLKKLHTEAVDERHQFYRKMGLNTAAAALLKRIEALEFELLQAVAECYDIHVAMEPPRGGPTSRRTSSVHDFYKPSLALQDVVRQGAKPRI